VVERTYRINEVFYTLQGEGRRAGEASLFIRFSGCNLACSFCDTEFESGKDMDLGELLKVCNQLAPRAFCVLTGGEPMQQVDEEFVRNFKHAGFRLAVETNGMFHTPRAWFDWITVSPKTAEHTIKAVVADEVKYVRHTGQGIPQPACEATYHYLSPVWGPSGNVDREALNTCIELVKQHPWWRLSTQNHKWWGVR